MKPILCLDFDGVIHHYVSGWKGAAVIVDPPVPGAMEFIWNAVDHFTISIFSSRSNQAGGLDAMKDYVRMHMKEYAGELGIEGFNRFQQIQWPIVKPAAFLTIDDRAITFTGKWPSIKELKDFRPWNR